MTDQWVPAPPQPAPPDPPNGLPPANSWSPVTPCASADSPSIADGVIITGRPAVISAQPWQITVNDGGSPANFSIDHFDASGALIESPIFIDGSSGDVTVTHDPTQPLGVATKQYADNNPNYVEEAPINNTTYGRDNATWVPLPGSYMPEAPNTTQRYGRFNSIWQLDAIQTDAPNDGAAYARQNGAWTAAVTGGPYMPTSGGTFTGVVTFPSNNSVAINGPINTQHAILGQVAGLSRWQLQMPDYTPEGVGNAGANFSLTAFNAAGGMLGTWLTIARSDGATTFSGAGVTIAGALAVNGLLAVANVGNLSVPGGSSGQVLSTNGSGVLSWATRLADAPSDGQFYTRQNAAWAIAPGGMTDAPNDGTAYARKSAAWAHLTHTDITDWTATLAPYALITSVPIASSTLPLANGVAAVGTSAAYARADHVHPSDAYPHDNRIINGDMRIDQRNNGASGTAIAYTVDRWQYYAGLAAKGTWGRNLNAVAGPAGFPYYLGFQSSSAYTLTTNDIFQFYQVFEGDAVSDFAWGTANAQAVTVSFWARSSLTGTFGAMIGNYAATRSYPFSYSIPAANTWTRIVVTIPGDTAGAWALSGNAGAIWVVFDLGSGATKRGPANAWASADYEGVTGAVSVVATLNATFYVTGVKLEIGSVATPFPRQSLAKSMADCQRYYQQLGGAAAADLIFQSYALGAGGGYASSTVGISAMRAAPTATRVGTWTTTNLASASLYPGISSLGVQLNATASGAVGMNTASATTYITLSAEL